MESTIKECFLNYINYYKYNHPLQAVTQQATNRLEEHHINKFKSMMPQSFSYCLQMLTTLLLLRRLENKGCPTAEGSK